MSVFAIALLAQLAAPARQTLPVLAFPEKGLDDTASYQGYQTRFYRDGGGNTVQIYLDGRSGRVVHLLADSENGSVAFTARDSRGRPAPLRWDSDGALVSEPARTRVLEYRLVADAPHVHLGWPLLGSMRVERDFQYADRHRAPFAGPAFALPEIDRLLAALGRLGATDRRRHLELLGAADERALRARLRPSVTTRRSAARWTARIVQPSLDGRDTLVLELQVDPRRVVAARVGDSLSLRARVGTCVPFTVRIATTATPLTPLTREEIFTPEFLAFLATAHAAGSASAAASGSAALRARWLERQVRGVELLVSREKLMAGLPAYATYFGRDMLVSALMMRSIWRDEMSEFAIASALRRLSPRGEVSHEEALGGQAVREGAAEYATIIDRHVRAVREGKRTEADSLLSAAGVVLRDIRRVRENYHMIDDEFQLPVLAARWLGDAGVPPERKRAFLLDSSDGETRLARLLRELALVIRMTHAYAREPLTANLVSFPPRDSGRWSSASWRDSNAGYAGGRFAMDVNAIWVPHALESVGAILRALRGLGFTADSLATLVPEHMSGTPLGGYARDSLALSAVVETWRGAALHFVVRLDPEEVRSRVQARVAAMPAGDRDYWTARLAAAPADRDSLVFLAIALDAEGRPIGVANSDPATALFLGEPGGPSQLGGAAVERALRDVRLFVRDYPVGLFIDKVGPVVANDSYALPVVWQAFDRDRYHGPRVVWGREVNLFLLGVTERLADPAFAASSRELRLAIDRVMAAVEASGFQSELWSYEMEHGKLMPVRYGTGSDVQLWSTTDLAVQFALSRVRQ